MIERVRVQILSDQDYEDLIAEGYLDDECILIVSQDRGFQSLQVELLPRKDGNSWRLEFSQLTDLLQRCKDRLWEMRKE